MKINITQLWTLCSNNREVICKQSKKRNNYSMPKKDMTNYKSLLKI